MIEPLYDRILLRRNIGRTMSKGGIHLPQSGQETSLVCEVVAVGAGRINPTTNEQVPLSVRVGDRVLLGKYGGVEVEVNNEKLWICREDEVLAVTERAQVQTSDGVPSAVAGYEGPTIGNVKA